MAFQAIKTIALIFAFTLSFTIIPASPDPVADSKARSFGRMIQQDPPMRPNNQNQNSNQNFRNQNQGQAGPNFSGNQNQNAGPINSNNPNPNFPNSGFPNNNQGQRLPKSNFILDFENYVAHLPITSFEGDALLAQFPDRLNGRTTYRHLDPASIDKIVYETGRMDGGAEVVILTQEEDRIPLSKKSTKRVFVVLRRALLLDPRLYYVSYVYVTEPPAGSRGVHNLGERKVYLEWDFWDHREVDDPSAKQLEYAFGCSNTIFVPCVSNETSDYPNSYQKPHHSLFGTNYQAVTKPSFPSSDGSRLHVADGYDPNEFMDIYWDLEKELQAEKPRNTNEQSSVPMPQFGRGLGIIGQVIKKVENVMRGVIQAGCGLLKSFGGLFGGLGTYEADPGGVTSDVGIEGSDDVIASNDASENDELDAEVKSPAAGGLGGLISDDKVKPSAKGRDIGKAWDPIVEEKPYVQFGWRMANDANSANDAFVGFGGCRYHRVTAEKLEATVTETDLLRLYKTALKTQCVLYDGEFLQEILNDGLLRSQIDKTFRLVKDSPHFQLEKLNVKQLKELLRGVELYSWSKVYAQELRSPTPSTTAPDGSTLSRSVFTLGQSFLQATAMAQQDLYPMKHGFKLGRNLIKTLKVAYLKLLEDYELFGDGDAGFEKEINFNDRVYVMCIIQYFIHGVTPVFVENVNPTKNFEDFYRQNKPFLEDRVNSQTPVKNV